VISIHPVKAQQPKPEASPHALSPYKEELTLRLTYALTVGSCLLAAAQLALSQTKPASIPGFYNPITGEFTTRVTSHAKPAASPAAATTGTTILFTEDFPITITSKDQPSTATVVCTVSLAGEEIGTGQPSAHSEIASSLATNSGGTWSCDVPILASWVLQNPTTTLVSAGVTVAFYSGTSVTSLPGLIRESIQNVPVTLPANSATVQNPVSFVL
jgi:hypothetical protein